MHASEQDGAEHNVFPPRQARQNKRPRDVTDARSADSQSAGPIADAGTLCTTLAEAVEVVRGGRPALVDVLTPPF